MHDTCVDFSAPTAVRLALAAIGRTEDVSVSRDGSRLALAAFNKNEIHVFALAIKRSAIGVTVDVPACIALSSDMFRQPHGCAFLGSEHLLVCNRGGDLNLIRVPQLASSSTRVKVRPQLIARGRGYLRASVKTPGSVAAYPLDAGRFRAFVCSDQWHFVTGHVIGIGEQVEVIDEGIRIEAALEIPDGISFSPDREWIAISNHVQGTVQLFRNTPTLNRRTPPDVILGGSVCPHGVSFDDAGHLYVADAASPYVHCYRRPEEGWVSQSAPARSFRMLDDETFYRGRYAAREGGVKGVHVDKASNVLVTTHSLGSLEFHDLVSLWSRGSHADADQLAALRRDRDAEIELTKSDVLRRRWNLRARLRKEIGIVTGPVLANGRALVPYVNRMRLNQVNRYSSRSLIDSDGPIVSMTSHSIRIALAHLAIESIARGIVRPKRMMLWLPKSEAGKPLPKPLLRLVSRGLEIFYIEDLGPHTKYFPYVASQSEFRDPLVTADDDIIYPRDWLAALVEGHQREPRHIHTHRARRMRFNQGHFAPYWSWKPATDCEPHPLNFLIGASGAIYPPEYLCAVKNHGTTFTHVCPSADDIWLNFVAFRCGVPVAQLARLWPDFQEVPGSQLVCLSRKNIDEGGNQIQLAETYCREDRANLLRFAST